jgi:hypothetical protein
MREITAGQGKAGDDLLGASLCRLPRELFLRGGRRGYGSGRRRLPTNQRGLWSGGTGSRAVEVGASARNWEAGTAANLEMELARKPWRGRRILSGADFRLGRADVAAAGLAALLPRRFCFLRRLRVGSEEDAAGFDLAGAQPSPAAIFLSDGPSARDTSRPGCKAHGPLRFGKKARSWWPTHGSSCQSALAGQSAAAAAVAADRRRPRFDVSSLTCGGGGCRSASSAMLEQGEC